jgi:hypothetical protein
MAPGGVSPMVKIYAFGALVIIQSSIGAINKIALQTGGGQYKFHPSSALTMAEFIKLAMAVTLHIMDVEESRADTPGKSFLEKIPSAKLAARRSLSAPAVFHILTLALSYFVNNQLGFYLNMLTDPGTIFLFKSGSTVITAVMLKTFLGRPIVELQWAAIVMQVCGLVIVQYDSCTGSPALAASVYLWMTFGTCITASNACRDDHLLKSLRVSMHLQTMVLYCGGVVLNTVSFWCIPSLAAQGIGFFEGYDNIWALLVILLNAMIGIAIATVYKYCDAVVRTFATATVAVVMVLFSSVYLGNSPNLVAWCGVTIVACSTWLYSRTGALGGSGVRTTATTAATTAATAAATTATLLLAVQTTGDGATTATRRLTLPGQRDFPPLEKVV